jgi:hypothetical protein
MNIQKILLSTIGAGIVMFLLAGLWHMALMSDLYAGDMNRAEPSMYLIGGSYLVLALLMSYMYPKGIEGTNKIANGIKFGIVIGLLWVLPHSLVLHAVIEGSTLRVVFIDVAWHAVEQACGGVVIALIYGIPNTTNTSS